MSRRAGFGPRAAGLPRGRYCGRRSRELADACNAHHRSRHATPVCLSGGARLGTHAPLPLPAPLLRDAPLPPRERIRRIACTPLRAAHARTSAAGGCWRRSAVRGSGRRAAACWCAHACSPRVLEDAWLTWTSWRAGASSLTLSIAGAGEHVERGSWIRLSNGHAWSPADLSMVTLQLSRRLDAADSGNGADARHDRGRRAKGGRGSGGLRLVSELSFADEQRDDPEGCAAVLGDAGSVPPGSSLTLWQGARCSFAFLPIRQGDWVQLLHGARVSCFNDKHRLTWRSQATLLWTITASRRQTRRLAALNGATRLRSHHASVTVA